MMLLLFAMIYDVLFSNDIVDGAELFSDACFCDVTIVFSVSPTQLAFPLSIQILLWSIIDSNLFYYQYILNKYTLLQQQTCQLIKQKKKKY